MSYNSKQPNDESTQTHSVKQLLVQQLTQRTSLKKERIAKMVAWMSPSKASKNLDFLVGDMARYDYASLRAQRNAAQEEFMFITDGNVDAAVEMLLGSEIVGDANPEALRWETERTFRRTGESIRSDPDTWYSTE
jgi:hypothetical protein